MAITLITEVQKNDNRELAARNPLSVPTPKGPEALLESSVPVTLRELCAAAEVAGISRALAQTGWNRRRAAKLLSISYRGLLYKIRQYNITPEPRQ